MILLRAGCNSRFLFFAALFAIAAAFTPFSMKADDASCSLSGDENVHVCFANPPLTAIHCDGTIVPSFRIARRNDAPYYLTFRVFADFGSGDTSLVDPPKEAGHGTGERTYLLTDEDAITQAETDLSIPFQGDGNYYIEVTVYAKGIPAITKTSSRIALHDQPLVKSIVVGVSRYDNGSDDNTDGKPFLNLFHADSDAHAFYAMLTQLFPHSPPILLTSDQTNSDLLPTPDNVMNQIKLAVKDPGLCSDNDWFIFYFSGHGVLSSDGRNIQHYLSTKSLDPANLPSTAIWVGDLLTKIEQVRAGNKLIVLDSCFSGTHWGGADTTVDSGEKGVTVSKHYPSKVQYVYKGKAVGPFQAGNDPDAQRPSTTMNNIELAHGRALFLSAAKADHEAEEGYEAPKPTGGIIFTPAGGETSEQKANGHGLYTFSLVWDLESLLSKRFKYDEVLGGKEHSTNNSDKCTVDFMGARDLVNADFVNKIEKTSGSDLQKPDSIQTRRDLPPAKCTLPTIQGSSDAQPIH
jgi:hypothetical protein